MYLITLEKILKFKVVKFKQIFETFTFSIYIYIYNILSYTKINIIF